jgi:hypothetical protein
MMMINVTLTILRPTPQAMVGAGDQVFFFLLGAPRDRPAMAEIQTKLHEAFAQEIHESSKPECVVCLNAEPVMALPCAHRCACEQCRPILKICPVCRADVNEAKRIYC